LSVRFPPRLIFVVVYFPASGPPSHTLSELSRCWIFNTVVIKLRGIQQQKDQPLVGFKDACPSALQPFISLEDLTRS
jgi:hypothetical protein